MDLNYSEEHEAFRDEVRQFINAHRHEAPTGQRGGQSPDTGRKWQQLLIEHGYAARSIPKEYGGYGAEPDILKNHIIAEEFAIAKLRPGSSGDPRLVPTLLELGTEEQKKQHIPPSVRGEISFENVSFAYPDRDNVLREFNLEIAAGETVAFTGPNGAGKTTLAHLLMRFADPGSGRILIDSTDTRECTLASVRERIGLVAQHVLLLNGTVAENIAYSEPLADRVAIELAAKAAHAHAFICELPDGYDTIIGDQGVKLSGGQRQRVSLARTLLKDPPILILDEATAMFDPAGEKAFIEECHDLLMQKTVILITHRPASLALADRVLAIDHGKVSVVKDFKPDLI